MSRSEWPDATAEVLSFKSLDPGNGPDTEFPYFMFEVKNLDEFIAWKDAGADDENFSLDITIKSMGFNGDDAKVDALGDILDMVAKQF